MNIRIPEGVDAPLIDDLEPVLKWHSLKCELVTPMYGGGVQSVVVDEKMPIRVASIRGQLRSWWRLLAKHKWHVGNGDPKALRKAEFALWGGMGKGEEDGVAGQVFLKITDMPSANKVKNSLVDYDDASLSKVKYVLFPAYNETDPDLTPHRLLKAEDITWTLDFAFSPLLEADEEKKEQVIETLRWWATFSGVGFRSRKGLGGVRVTESADYPEIAQPLSADEVAEAGCQLVQRRAVPTALQAIESAISKLSDFRQAPGVGRNTGQQRNRPGRSRWPEPDALRRIQNTHHIDHAPEHPAGNVFPRGVFGLPILFPFVGRDEPSGDNTVSPVQGERLASPLIFKAIYAGEDKGKEQWLPTALVLPYQHILDMQVEVGREKYPIWNSDIADKIRPINDNGCQDPMQAFLTYFSK